MLRKLFNKQRKNLGLPPGTFITESNETNKEEALLIKYNENFFEKELVSDNINNHIKDNSDDIVYWFNLDSTKYTDLLNNLQETAGINSLILEDIVNTHQRPKFEDWDHAIFIVAKMLYFNEEKELELEQVSFILKKNMLISIQEKPGDIFNIIRNRLASNKGRIRKQGADYLLYTLLDTIIDHYFIIIDDVNNLIEEIEMDIYDNPNQENLIEMQTLKQDISITRRYVSPVRELVHSMMRSDSELIGENIYIYLQDLHDHCLQVNDSMDMLKDLSTGIIEICNTSQSNRMNDIMKVLTIISTIFIPLSFLAGLYGMNFINMPELSYPYSYPILLGIMALVAIGMLYYFKRKNWF